MRTSEHGSSRARDFSKKAVDVFRQFMNERQSLDGSIRPHLIEGMDYLEKAIISTNNRIVTSINMMNLYGWLCNASRSEFQYAINRVAKWFELGYKNSNNCLANMLKCELGKCPAERRLDWDDCEYVDIIIKCNATIGMPFSKLLHNPTVRGYYIIKKANSGDCHYAFELGKYYYESGNYSEAYNTLKDLTDDHVAKYLGLMYYYGRGTEQNHKLAREYLERYYDNYCPVEDEVIWILGKLYGRYENKRKQFDLYITSLESPYRDDDNKFINKMLKQCVCYKQRNTARDWIRMTVEIKPENLECEFTFDLAPCCNLIVDWGDGSCDRYGDLEKTGTIICRHIYSRPEAYTINIQSLLEKSIEGFDFSRYKRQLHSIYLGNCAGLKKLSVIGQSLTSLDLAQDGHRKPFLTGVICRDNMLTKLNLRYCPNIIHFDCSFNPVTYINLPKYLPLSVVAIPAYVVNKVQIDELLKLNRGNYVRQVDYEMLLLKDMRFEYFVRLSTWEKVRKYIRENELDYYDHFLAECESTFKKLKELSKDVNHNPYEDRGGFLAVDDSYISDDTILYREDFFIKVESWETILATKLRDIRRREPWMGFPPTPPEYYVANCLVNMIKSWRELKSK